MGKYQFLDNFPFARTIGRCYFRWIRYSRMFFLKSTQDHTAVLYLGPPCFWARCSFLSEMRFFRQLHFPEYKAGFLVMKLSGASWTFNYGRRVSDNEMETSCSWTITSEKQYTAVGKCNLILNWLRNFPWNINSIFCSPLNVSQFFSFSLGSLQKVQQNSSSKSVDSSSLLPFAIAWGRRIWKQKATVPSLIRGDA